MSDAGSEVDPKDAIPSIGIYEGERNAIGQRHGKGKNTYPNGDNYDGTFVEGKRSGSGVYRFKNGARYIGDFQDGHKHGKGKFFYADGSKYEGEFVNGKRQGTGTFLYANGDVYTGQWLNDMKQGQGVYTYSATKTSKDGTWLENVLQGSGTIYYADHTVKANFTSSDRIDVPAKYTFLSTGYETVVKDLNLIDQLPVVPVEN